MPHSDTSLAVRTVAAVRAVPLALSVAWRQLTDDPMRAAVLAHRVTPRRLKSLAHPTLVRVGGPLSRAFVRWDEARDIATTGVGESRRTCRRLASFSVAVDRPDVAAGAVERLPDSDRARRALHARVAWQQGHLHDALETLRDPSPRRAQTRLRRRYDGELKVLDPAPRTATPTMRRIEPVPGRVLHLVTNALPHKNAGYTVRTQRIAAGQRAVGLDAHVVTRLGFPVAQGVLDGRPYAEVDGVPYHRLLPRTLPRTADAAVARAVDLAAELVERLRPAVLHAASPYGNGQVALALRDRFGLPVVYEVRGFLEDSWLSRAGGGHGQDSDLYRLSRAMETHCMREADLVVTLGAAMAEEIVGRGLPAEKVLVVPNGVDDAFFDPLPEAGGLRARLGIPADAVVVGTTSSCYGYEGLDALLRAGAELLRRDAPVRLLLVGDGPELTGLRRQARELGMSGAVTFTGRVPVAEVRRYHAVLDVFVVPRTDTRVCHLVTPLKPVEAMASGLPVVASEVTAMREIVEPGVTGVLTPPEDPCALADALEDLVYSPYRRRDLGLASRERVARHRTWRRAADRYRTAYATLGPGPGV